MTKSIPQVKIVNAETGEEIIRDANTEELAQMAIDNKESLQRKTELETKAFAKAELLDRLGITEDEVKLLLA